MFEADRRRLLLAMGASALLHAGLLTKVVTVQRVRLDGGRRPLQAVINLQGREMAPEVPVAAATRATRSLAATHPRRFRAQTGARATVSGAAVAAPSTAAEPARFPASGSEATPGAAAASALAGEAVSADDLRQYRMALAIAARRFKRYPPLARERGWQGRVEIAVRISAWQRVPQLALSQSSGHAALDEQALAMIEQAALSTLVPERLQGRDFQVLLPIEFSLEEAR